MENKNVPTEQNNQSFTQNPYANNHLAKMDISSLNAGAMSIETSKAIEEVRIKILTAKMFPRDKARAFEEITKECSRKALAEEAIYSYPRGGQTVSGASIRLAEMLVRCWGNIEAGIIELASKEGLTEYKAYAWDLETNSIFPKTFTVKHERHTTKGSYALTDPRDIYEMGANIGARRLRACILAVIPNDIVEYAMQKCRETMAGGSSEPIEDKVRKLLTAFVPYGINKTHIEKRLCKKLETITLDELIDLRGIFVSIRDGHSKTVEWFNDSKEVADGSASQKLNEK